MGIDWRLGADWFETLLQDYDVCSNWCNWVSAAGLTGGRINHFNITKQSKVRSSLVSCYEFGLCGIVALLGTHQAFAVSSSTSR